MNDVFISYARFDSVWVEAELMQALKELGVTFFLDDAEWRKRKADVDARGLQPGQDLLKALDAALRSSRVILLVHSPAYFVSKWCRWELELAEKLAAKPLNSRRSLKLIYLILSRHDERLDLSHNGERVLSVDLTKVCERAEKLSFALQSVSPKARRLRCTLGRRSLQDLLAEPEVQGQIKAFGECHKMFRDAHGKMQAFKESHDAIQCAQDAWHTLAAARDDISADGKDVLTLQMASDLFDKCNRIRNCINAPVLAGEVFAWRGQLDRAITAAAEFLTQTKNLEVLNQTLERTRSFLLLSVAPIDLNNRIRAASESLPIDSLTDAVEPLKRLQQYPWQPEPLAKLTELSVAFDQLAALLTKINDLVAVHDVLQNIDTVFSTAINVEAKLADIENIWPDIEAERKRIAPHLAANQTLQLLGTAADIMSNYLRGPLQADNLPKAQLEFFKRRLNQSFVCTDTDLRQDTLLLDQKHENIDGLLGRLASPS